MASTQSRTVSKQVQDVLDSLPPERDWFAIRSVLFNLARHDDALAAIVRRHMDRFHDEIEPLLTAAVAQSGRVLTVPPDLFTRAVVAAHIGATTQRAAYADALDVRAAAVEGVVLGLSIPAGPAPS